ncbi:hypothetical protein [Acinetobacter baumannii]|uniref:hypothetical protein n=2 Tax=Acinetobacter baumannii TaxID=470 RepID=UPI003C719CAC
MNIVEKHSKIKPTDNANTPAGIWDNKMESLVERSAKQDLDTFLRFICTYALNDTYVSKDIITESLKDLPQSVVTFVYLLEFSPNDQISSITSISDSVLKTLSELIHNFRNERINSNGYSIIFDFFSANPFSYFIYFLRNVITANIDELPLVVNLNITDFFQFLLDRKSSVFHSRIFYFIRAWQTVSVYNEANISELKETMLYASQNKVFPNISVSS